MIIRRTVTEVSGHLYEVDTKTHRVFAILIPNFLCRQLEDYIERYVGSEGRVFTAPRGGLLRHDTFYERVFKPALRKADLDPNLRFHDLRYTAASIAGNESFAGESAKVVQHMLNHSTQQVTTEIYTHLFPEDLERLREKLDRVYQEAEVGSAGETERRQEAAGGSLLPIKRRADGESCA